MTAHTHTYTHIHTHTHTHTEAAWTNTNAQAHLLSDRIKEKQNKNRQHGPTTTHKRTRGPQIP